jgi:hypothetical protein
MHYTVQLHTESGSFATPSGIDIKHCHSLASVRRCLERWQDSVHRFDEAPCSALVWRGTLSDVADILPDAEATLGPRGGFRVSVC